MNSQISLMSNKILAWAVVLTLVLSIIPTITATHDEEDIINVENGLFAWNDDELNNDLAFYAHSAGEDLDNITISVWKKLPSGNWTEYDDGETDDYGEVIFFNVTSGEYKWEAYEDNEKIDYEGGYSLVSNNYDLGHVGFCDDDVFGAYVMDGDETIDSAYVEIYDVNGTLVDYGYTDEEEDDNFTLFLSDDLEVGYHDFFIWEEYNNSDSLLQNGSFYFLNESDSDDSDYDVWFDYMYVDTYDEDDDGYEDTIEWQYDPDTGCECEVDITVTFDVYDNGTGDWIDGDALNYTIYYDDGDDFSHSWDPWYNGSFDFYVELFDEDGNLADDVSYFDVSLNVKGQGGDDEDDDENINDYLGVVFEDGGASEDAYYDIYDSDGWVDGGHANSDGFFISEDLDEGWYYHYIYLNNDTDEVHQKGPFYSYGDSTNHTVINVDMAVLEDEDEDGEPTFECSDNATCDDAYFRAHQGNWEDGISNVTIQISKYDENGTLDDYDVIYTNESGDAVSYDSPCGEYVWEATYFGNEIDNGTYLIWANCNTTSIEDFGIGHYGVILSESDASNGDDEDYDEWFNDWYYEYQSNDTVKIYFDPNTDCDCDIYVFVDMYVYDSDGDYVDHFSDEGYIYGDEEEWWDLIFTADYTDYYSFNFDLWDNDNYEDNFSLNNIYLEVDDNGGDDEDSDDIGHVGEITDWHGDEYVNDYLGAVSYDREIKEDAYYEIYDENGNLIDSGHPNTEFGVFISANLSEGVYYGVVYYEESDDLLQMSSFYSYGNSSGNTSNVINVEMGVMEDEDEEGEPNLFCEDGPCDDAFFRAHIGDFDNGVAGVEIEICKYDDDNDECEYYDTIQTNSSGDAISYDGDCGVYEWNATYMGDEIDGGAYRILAHCDNNGGGGDDGDYVEWFNQHEFDVDGYEINIWYDPNTGCDCYVEVEVYVDIFKDNDDPDDDGYVDSIDELHMIYSDDSDWFVQNWSALHYGEGQYEFHVYLYDQEHEHDEDEFWIYDVYLGDNNSDDCEGISCGFESASSIIDWEEDGTISDFIAVVDMHDYDDNAWYSYEIYDSTGDQLIAEGSENLSEVVIYENLTEGWYHYVLEAYVDGEEYTVQSGMVYSYGESDDYDELNIDSWIDHNVVEFSGYYGAYDANNGPADIEIIIHQLGDDNEWHHYETIYTGSDGRASLSDTDCGKYIWSAVDSNGNELEDGKKGSFIMTYCEPEEEYDLWIMTFNSYPKRNNDTGLLIWDEAYVEVSAYCTNDCEAEVRFVLKIYDENGNIVFEDDKTDWVGNYIQFPDILLQEPGDYEFVTTLYEIMEDGSEKYTDESSFSAQVFDFGFDYSVDTQDNEAFLKISPYTNYGGDVDANLYVNICSLEENEDECDGDFYDWFTFNVSMSNNDIEEITLNWTLDDGQYALYIGSATNWLYFWGHDEVRSIITIISNKAPDVDAVNINGVLANNAMLYEGQDLLIRVDASDVDGDDLTYTWNMGDGGPNETSNANTFDYRYLDDGKYDFIVSVSDGVNTWTETFKLDVKNKAPVLTFPQINNITDEGKSLGFTVEPEDVIADEVTVTWTFEGGITLEGNFVQYMFKDDGIYQVVVTAKDDDGGETVEVIKVTVKNVAPVFEEFMLPTSAEEGQLLDFRVSASDPGDDTITYTFDFGDGTAQLLTKDGNVSHKFAEGDTFTIVICALDEDGGETCRTEELPVSLLEQLEESGLPGFGLVSVISALGVIGILRRRTH
ncbi:MAG: PKD domain-containing protein [Candidatus Poseidoniales archaeon]